jgi:hypothetical protein
MKLPLTLLSGCDDMIAEKWHKQFVLTGRTSLEGLWRRTQESKTKEQTGWVDERDARRRVLHYFDTYNLVDGSLILEKPYLLMSIMAPLEEVAAYKKQIMQGLTKGSWEKKSDNLYVRNDLQVSMKTLNRHPEDEKSGRTFPENYQFFEITLTKVNEEIPLKLLQHPWEVLNSGFRTILTSGNPRTVSNLSELKEYMPMQVELGCGPSIEAGIPPLHELHRVYRISQDQNRKFVLKAEDDDLWFNVLSDPETFYREATTSYVAALTSQPTNFYRLLKELYDNNIVVGDIINNNFDGLAAALGLKERYIRQYTTSELVPEIDFDPRAKSLLVVGSHADRRRVQEAARNKGLQVIYVDPEGYDDNGRFVPYPQEAPQDNDIVIRMTADEFATRFREVFNISKKGECFS